MTAVPSLSVSVLFAVIFLFGSRAYRPGLKGYRCFLSFAAGIAVAYVFVDVLPALGRMQDIVMNTPSDFQRAFPEYSVYLWAMAGFLFFYCIETMVVAPWHGKDNHAEDHDVAASWQAWIHVGGFAAYAWVLSYVMVCEFHDPLALTIYAVAMGMHIFPIACNLSSHHKAVYDRRGAFLVALASLAGWASGVVFEIPEPLAVSLVAVVVGGVIVNTSIAELPKKGEGRPGYFLGGAIVYSALLLILSHFAHGGG